MSRPQESISIVQLDKLLKSGDYHGFVDGLNLNTVGSYEWEKWQVKSFTALYTIGDGKRALSLARNLRNQLSDTGLRKLVDIEYHYLKWLYEGRAQADVVYCLGESGKIATGKGFDDIKTQATEINLRIKLVQLMLGMRDAGQKQVLYRGYMDIIHRLKNHGLSHEAFHAAQCLIKFLRAKPFPNDQEALVLIHCLLDQRFIAANPYYEGCLQLTKAEILLAQALQQDKKPKYNKFFDMALDCFERANQSRGRLKVMMSMGELLLKYGHVSGRKILDRLLRQKKALDAQDINRICRAITLWLKESGRFAALKHYQSMMGDVDGHKRDGQSTKTNQVLEKDAGLVCQMGLSHVTCLSAAGDFDAARPLLNELYATVSSFGKTKLKADVLVELGKSNEGWHTNQFNNALSLYVEMGYQAEAMKLIHGYLKSSLSAGLETAKVSALVKKAEEISEGNCDLSLSQMLAQVYELSAVCLVLQNESLLTMSCIKKAQSVYHRFGLRPKLAYSQMYLGFSSLIIGSEDPCEVFFDEAYKAFKEAFALFKLLNYAEGMFQAQKQLALLDFHRERAGLSISLSASTRDMEHCEKAFEIRKSAGLPKLGTSVDGIGSKHQGMFETAEYRHFTQYIMNSNSEAHWALLQLKLN